MTLLGIDYGDARTGVAVAYGSGPALPLCTVDSSVGRARTSAAIAKLCAEKACSTVVIGYPVNIDGSTGKRTKVTEKFARALKTELEAAGLDAEVAFMDERLTTRQAEAELRRMDLKAAPSDAGDQIAAAIILDSYIALHSRAWTEVPVNGAGAEAGGADVNNN